MAAQTIYILRCLICYNNPMALALPNGCISYDELLFVGYCVADEICFRTIAGQFV